MSSAGPIVIIGAGQAGGRAAAGLRHHGFGGRITIVGEERHPPYERPPLSKQVLTGEREPDSTHLSDRGFYDEQNIELRLGVRVTAIDRAGQLLKLDDGAQLAYDRLVIATGSRARRLALPGFDLAGVCYLRGIDDSIEIRDAMTPGTRVAIVGAGYVGLEVAAAAVKRGCSVTILEATDTCLGRVVAPEVARFYAAIHRGRGVSLQFGAGVAACDGNGGRVGRVLCADGLEIDADVVVVGIGATPNVELAPAAGLAVENGITVDEYGRTSDPVIHAVGDVTNHPNALLGRRLRLESWQNAQNQAACVARAMCGASAPYAEVPWFWSDQYDLNLQIVGVAERWDRLVVRGDMAGRCFSAFYLDRGKLVAANAVNNPRDIPVARRLIAANATIDADTLADPQTSLRELLKATQG